MATNPPATVVDYLTARGINQTATLALVAPTSTCSCRPSSILSSINGVDIHGTRHSVADFDRPVVRSGASPMAGGCRPSRQRAARADSVGDTCDVVRLARVARGSSPDCTRSTPSPSSTTHLDLATSCPGASTTPPARSTTLPPLRQARHRAVSRRSRLSQASSSRRLRRNRRLGPSMAIMDGRGSCSTATSTCTSSASASVRPRCSRSDYWCHRHAPQSRSFSDMADEVIFLRTCQLKCQGPAYYPHVWAHLRPLTQPVVEILEVI